MNRPVGTEGGHGLASESAQGPDPWIVPPWIQAELAEFWAQRAQARQAYRRSKALRERESAMAAASARPARRAAPGLVGAARVPAR